MYDDLLAQLKSDLGFNEPDSPLTMSYAELLLNLRQDLSLDLSVDVQPGTAASLANLGIARGTATLAFTAAALSAAVSVAHGLAATPTAVVASPLTVPTAGEIPTCNPYTFTPTTFQLVGETKTVWTGAVLVSWIALI